jgi:hypothetical protein
MRLASRDVRGKIGATDGDCLISVPMALRRTVRSANYGVSSYTHEVVAEVFALLMERRQRGQGGKPAWLDPEIYDLICRVTGWME